MPNGTNMKKLENGRAEFAYACVEKAKNPDLSKYAYKTSEYKSYAKKALVLIQTNGLGNTLAFIISKSKTKDQKTTAWGLIYEQLSEWLESDSTGCTLLTEDSDLLKFVISQPSSVYRQITTEVMAFMNWLKRLADGMIEGGEDHA